MKKSEHELILSKYTLMGHFGITKKMQKMAYDIDTAVLQVVESIRKEMKK